MEKAKIYYETNLTRFKFHECNRPTDDVQSKNHIKAMSENMAKSGFRSNEPIIVTRADKDGKFYVIDGQHRLLAAIAAGIYIYYVIDESVKLTSKSIFEAFVKYNENKKVVRKNDYVHGYAKMGNENFITLQEFGEQYPMFTLTERMMLLRNSGTKHAGKENFAKGKFDVADVKIAHKWANYLLQLREHFESGFNKSVFVRTMLTILEKEPNFKFDEFVHKVKIRPGSIHLCGDKKSYAQMIEDIYNYKRKSEDKLNLRLLVK